MRAKFIYEKFTEDSDPIQDLGIGSRELIIKWLKKYKITKYTINGDLSIDVADAIDFINTDLIELPEYISFNYVSGPVWIKNNENLISLIGFPQKIDHWFVCINNPKLETLDGGPKYVGDDYLTGGNGGKFTEKYIRSMCQVKKRVSTDVV